MNFDEALEYVLRDERSHKVPILFIVQTLIICEDNHLFKEETNVPNLSTPEPNNMGSRNRRSKGLSIGSWFKQCTNG